MHSSLFTEPKTDSREFGLLFFRFFRDSCLFCVLQNPTDHLIARTRCVLCTIVCLKNPKTDSSKLDSCFWFWKYRLFKCWKGREKKSTLTQLAGSSCCDGDALVERRSEKRIKKPEPNSVWNFNKNRNDLCLSSKKWMNTLCQKPQAKHNSCLHKMFQNISFSRSSSKVYLLQQTRKVRRSVIQKTRDWGFIRMGFGLLILWSFVVIERKKKASMRTFSEELAWVIEQRFGLQHMQAMIDLPSYPPIPLSGKRFVLATSSPILSLSLSLSIHPPMIV